MRPGHRTSRRAVLAGAAAAALSAPLVAARAADAAAAAPIQALNAALIAAMKAGTATPFGQRYAALAPVVGRAFDLPSILRTSVGLRWGQLSPAEQSQLLDAFTKFTVCSYVANFDGYSGQRIDVLPGARTVNADQVVETALVSGGDSTRIDYVMHNTPEGWKAIDVLLNGSISQAAVNRSDWRGPLASGAGALVARLQSKVADLSGGAIH